jgi:tetratricopeptide (TPR) repeat protein
MTLRPPKVRSSRNVIPRWREQRIALESGEVRSLQRRDAPKIIVDTEALEKEILEFNATPSLGIATDIASNCVALGEEKRGREFAEFILKHRTEATDSAMRLAFWLLEDHDKPSEATENLLSPEKKIHKLRSYLRQHPHDAMTWLNLGLAYASVGLNPKAEFAIKMALKLYPHNRTILRVATRYFIHSRQQEVALKLLRSNAATEHDPWLIAAELSTASITPMSSEKQRPPKFALIGRRMLKEGSFLPVHTSELAAAVATLEMNHGTKQRHVKQIFKQSLIDPTENTVAQVQWARTQDVGFAPDLQHRIFDIPHLHEAKSWKFLAEGKLKEALDEYREWILDEPFSTMPIDHASFLCLVLGDLVEALRLTESAKRIDPQNPLYYNNIAYYHAMNGSFDKAEESLRIANFLNPDARVKLFMHATEGLIAFGQGKPITGRKQYEATISMVENSNYADETWLALGNYSRAEYLYGNTEVARPLLKRARDMVANRLKGVESAFLDMVAAILAKPRSNL